MNLDIKIVDKLSFMINEHYRYKGAFGGRGGSKSYAFADSAIVRMMSEPTVVTVCRQYKDTIKDSVHKLIKDRIKAYGLEPFFHITDREIRCDNGSLVNYKHLHNNEAEIKGLEGTDICWIFEGQNLKKESADILFPTIRKPGSEIWIEFNPDYEDDYSYQFFVVNPPQNSKVVEINYWENPWCPQVLIDEAEECERLRPDDYLHIWCGRPRNTGQTIYPQFDTEVHVRDYDMQELVSMGANFFMSQDPHTAYYPACIWFARVPRGDGSFFYWIYNEFPTLSMLGQKYYYEVRKTKKCTLPLNKRAAMFRVLDKTIDKTHNEVEIYKRGIDTRFAKGSGGGSTTNNTRGIIIEMADPENGGLVFETPQEKRIDVQRDRLRGFMDYDKDMGINSFNEPSFYVASHCHNVKQSLKFHRYDKKDREREDETYKDFVDAIRIGFATEQEYSHRDLKEMNKIVNEVDPFEHLTNTYFGPKSGLATF